MSPDFSGTDPRDFDTTFLSAMSRRVLIGDGAMGTMLQAADLTLDDFNNLEGCNEILNDTRPDVLEGIHRAYFEAGADAVETNTFGCNLPNLADYDIADRIRELIQDQGALFVADTQVHHDPIPEEVYETVVGCARHVRRFGLTPRIALCSHSQFGNLDTPSGRKMREAMDLLFAREADFIFDGEMHVDAALDPDVRARLLPSSRLGDEPANVLVFAGTDAASAVRNVLKTRAGGLEVGPILMGMGNKAHIVTPSITARGLLNISALAGAPVHTYG